MSKRGLLLALLAVGVAVLSMRMLYDPADDVGAGAPQLSLEGIDRLAARFPRPDDVPLRMPEDHRAKPGQFAEYWLFGGRVTDGAGAVYGFHLAFYRLAVAEKPVERDSAWATRNIYRARFSVEPVGASAQGEERLSRDALGLAGASSGPAVWLEDWRFTILDDGATLLLESAASDAGMKLRLGRPVEGPLPIESELYRGYWWPGWQVEGMLEIGGESVPVRGDAMLDRLWGQALPVGRGQLALARAWLDLGEKGMLRCAQLRRRAGGGTPLTECISRPSSLAEDIVLAPADDGWRDFGGTRYPLAWTLDAPSLEQRRIAPLGDPPPQADGGWFGLVAVGEEPVAAGESNWGMLELSNFPSR
ncbi:carotenoid 1,2-hydratase [Wenzhouxiangella sp. XN24]|uniref:carotenoid 1,2-hydratase n=1 Tax=Wenzhouxiangella sp. XN24 TaxID=2713569 RepID=UPI0013EB7E37|nr:carotenoid 1,2-hydratase [Wenzhouxiangella sp. XN24]NGX15376.1 carotenoid 1,2-hydratase [Wenzhouxiangella sp. XN24]